MAKDKLIVDANLLLLMIIGAVDDGRFIRKSNRLNKYNEHDYQVLWEFVSEHEIFITHYIASEVSNLIDLKGDAAQKAFQVARVLFSSFTQIESCINEDSLGITFERYGLTDNSLIRLVSNYTVITDDNRLASHLFEICGDNVVPYETIRKALC